MQGRVQHFTHLACMRNTTAYMTNSVAMQGLTTLEKATGKLVILSNQVSADSPLSPGVNTNYANDLDIAKDGTVYFTTSTDKPAIPNLAGFQDTFHTFVLELLQVCQRVMT